MKRATDIVRATPGLKHGDASQAALATTELLEAVVLHMPYKQIFAIRLVCRRWRNCIDSSTRIRQKLFLQPCITKESWIFRMLPLMRVYEDYMPCNEYEFASEAENTGTSGVITPVALSPFSKVLFEGAKVYATQKTWPGEMLMLNMASLANSSGSWQAIYLTDPPCMTARVCVSFETSDQVWGSGFVGMCSESGITLGDVYHAAMEMELNKVEPEVIALIISGQKKRFLNIKAVLAYLNSNNRRDVITLSDLEIHVELAGVVVPSDRIWEEVKQKTHKT